MSNISTQNASGQQFVNSTPQNPNGGPPTKQYFSCANNSQMVANGSLNTFSQAGAICRDDCRAIDPNSICDPASCTCVSSCAGAGLKAAAMGINASAYKSTFNSSLELCKDDCKQLSPAAVCDPKTCACKIPIPTPRGCALNSIMTAFTGANTFNPATMICQDDCKMVDPTMTCNAQCVCQKPPPIACSANTKNLAATGKNTFNAAAMLCADDCKTVDPTMTCNPKTCTCQKPPQPSCAINSISVALSGGKNTFNPFGGQLCQDDCKNFDPSLICDATTCTCKKNPKNSSTTLYCATNTIFAEDSAGGSIYNASIFQCEDNCKELDPSLSCDPTTCTCKKVTENISVSCAGNTQPTTGSTLTKLAPGLICKDDCQQAMGSNYYCEPLSCQCIPKSRVPQVSCLQNSILSLYLGIPVQPLPVNYMCADDCNEPGFYCDPKSCVCKPQVNVTQGTSCALNTYEDVYGGNNTYAPGTMCADDCKVIGPGYTCDPGTCTCLPPKENISISCAGNTNPESGSTVEKLEPGMMCKDDCASLGDGYTCNPSSCTCQPPPVTENMTSVSCAESSVEVALTGQKAGPLPSGYICKDDCAEVAPGFVCDPNRCVCKPPATETGQTSCAGNSYDALYNGGENGFNASTGMCADDCANIDPSYTCDAATCTCHPPPTENITVSCSENTNPDATTVEKVGAGVMCKDDCASGYTCDASSCTCKPVSETTKPVIYCAANSFASGFEDVGNAFDARVNICEDNCNSLGEGYECDPSTCTCKPQLQPVSCSSNSFGVGTTGASLKTFDPSTQICEDDCAQLSTLAGVSLECDPKTCSCKPSEQVSCAQNGYTFDSTGGAQTLSTYGMECKDDCATIAPDAKCDPKTCMCVFPGENRTASCASRYYGSYGAAALPEGVMCKDDCASLGPGYTCDANCQCQPPPVTENETHGVCNYSLGRCESAPGSGVNECTSDADCTMYSGEHTVCVENSCLAEPGSGTNECITDSDCMNRTTELMHTECDYSHGICNEVPGPGSNQCSSDSDCTQTTPQTHTECQSGMCVSVDGAGTDQCQSSSDCPQPTTQEHYVCSGSSCVPEPGPGTDQCTSDEQCAPQYHYECDYSHQACMKVEGAGTSNCASDSDCAPPQVDCNAYCSGQGFSQSLGSGYATQQACEAAATSPAQQCTVTCSYAKFYTASNQAGSTTCCCKAVYTQQCTPTEGGGCTCPSQTEVENSICPAHQP